MTYTRQELQTIDALVTRFVMDYPSYDEEEVTAASSGAPTFLPIPIDRLKELQPPPPWTTDQELAMTVAKYLLDEGFRVTMEGGKNGWQVTFTYGQSTIVEHKAFAPKLSIAICLASLFTVGINPFQQGTSQI